MTRNIIYCQECGARYGRLSTVGKRVHKEYGKRLCNKCLCPYHKNKFKNKVIS